MGETTNDAGTDAAAQQRHVAIIGAGPGGISSGYYLRQHGYENFTIFEKADDVGGTWQRNRYPGLACDVWSHVYCFTFALNPSWTRSYAAQPEILAYMRKTVTDLNLWDKIRLNTGISECRWDDDTLPAPARLRELHDLREGRRGRRHVAAQPLPGPGVRRVEPRLLLHLRPEPGVDPLVRGPARDPRLHAQDGHRPRPVAEDPAEHRHRRVPLGRRHRPSGSSPPTAASGSRPTW